MLEGLRRRLASFPAGFELGWRGSLEKATVALQAVSFAVSSRSGQVGLSSYHGGLVVGHEGLSAHVPPLSTAARIVCWSSTDLVVSAMVVSAKVEQSALLPPDLSMAEMEVTMVCRPRQHIRQTVTISCSTKTMSKPRRLVACGSDQSPLGPGQMGRGQFQPGC